MPEDKPLSLRVPKRHIASIATLLHAPDEKFAAFERELMRPDTPLGISALVREAAGRAGWPNAQQAPPLEGLFVSLSSMADSYPDATVDEFADAVVRAAQATQESELQASDHDWATLRKRLQRLLAPECPLWLSSKGSIVVAEQERLFCDARILTDIRPVFGRGPAARPAALTVVHTLKIEFHHGSEDTEEIFIALDSGDLEDLKRVIQRAEAKQETLETLIRETGMPRLPSRHD